MDQAINRLASALSKQQSRGAYLWKGKKTLTWAVRAQRTGQGPTTQLIKITASPLITQRTSRATGKKARNESRDG
jgi:hypothetical protein